MKGAPRYRSKYEARVIEALCEANHPPHFCWAYEGMRYRYTKPAGVYTPDVTVWPASLRGGARQIEMKGYFKPIDRSKMKAVVACNPGIDLRILFQNAKVKLNKKSKTTYGEWATKHGFTWAEGNAIPEAWLQ